jgi:hypothetical protein
MEWRGREQKKTKRNKKNVQTVNGKIYLWHVFKFRLPHAGAAALDYLFTVCALVLRVRMERR